MADGGPPAPQPLPIAPPAPPVQQLVPPAQLTVPLAQPIPTQPANIPQLNWSHFKPEFAGKPNEDAEAHLLRPMTGWTYMHFQKVSKSLTPFMNKKDGYISKKVTFDIQDSLDEKIDRLTSMMSKLAAQDNNPNKSLNLRYIKQNGEDKQEISMIERIIIREITKVDIDKIVEIEEHHIEVEVSRDKIIEEDHIMSINIEMNIEEIISEICKIMSQNFRGGYSRYYRNDNYEKGRSRSRDRQYSDNTR